MSSRVFCWIHGHEWGAWDPDPWQNIFGVRFYVRWCAQCGARSERPA